MFDQRIEWIYKLIDTIFSLIRLVIHTNFTKTDQIIKKNNRCLVMGNGPSLMYMLNENKEKLSSFDLIAVNFMGLTSEYISFKPNIYVFCDPIFWFEDISDEFRKKVIDFFHHLTEKTDWPLQLYIPYQAKKEKKAELILKKNKYIKVCYYNKTKFESFKWLNYKVYGQQWGMPRAQNVLVAALMLAIYSNYKEIYLAGAESDWIKNLWVDENNKLYLNDIHYYKEQNIKNIIPLKIHEQLSRYYYMFKSYIKVEEYAVYSKIKIYNTLPNSFIDAFEKKNI